MDVKNLLKSLNLKAIHCEYCDIRVEETYETNIRINNHEVTTAVEQSSKGAFLRLRKNAQWYYSATTDLTTLQEQLMTLANSMELGDSTKWNRLPDNNGSFENFSYQNNNPTLIPLSEKVVLVKKYDTLSKSNPFVKSGQSVYKDMYRIKTFINSVGTFFQFDFAQCGGSILYDLADGEKKFTDHVKYYGETFDKIENESERIQKYIQESTRFLNAPLIEPGKYRLLLSPQVTGVFVHESFGHMSEADGMLGDPQAKEVWKLGKKVASEFVSIVDSGLHKGSSGYCPIDDEGFKATKTHLVKDGVLAGRLHSYDTADQMEEKPTGNARAISFEYEPIVRMTSTYIENGTTPLSELYKIAEGALLVEDFNFGTGGDLFTIAPGRIYLIKDGKPHSPLRANVISGQIFETLLNIEAIGNNFDLEHSSTGGCGKMDQFPLPVADGGPTVLVKDMQVS
ncbi:MAG: TldD/PmbA family protein [Pseudobdellovibrionaceae bacterium]